MGNINRHSIIRKYMCMPIIIAHFTILRPLRSTCLPGGKPPISHRVNAPNSFVLPTHEVDVSHAPMLGQRPYELIQPTYPPHLARFLQVAKLLLSLGAYCPLMSIHLFCRSISYFLFH